MTRQEIVTQVLKQEGKFSRHHLIQNKRLKAVPIGTLSSLLSLMAKSGLLVIESGLNPKMYTINRTMAAMPWQALRSKLYAANGQGTPQLTPTTTNAIMARIDEWERKARLFDQLVARLEAK